ncbi:hypothetical protein PENTCL1PPCAC_1348, partial [Pristionchus entomophagus]
LFPGNHDFYMRLAVVATLVSLLSSFLLISSLVAVSHRASNNREHTAASFEKFKVRTADIWREMNERAPRLRRQ